MFIPIGDSPNPPGTPWVNYSLIAANLLTFLLLLPQMSLSVDPRDPMVAELVTTMHEAGRIAPEQISAFLRQVSSYDLIVFKHGFRPGAPSILDAFTSMFLHSGWMHLLGNMLFLWIYGDNVELRIGRLAYLGAYFVTGLAATSGDALIRAGSDVPAVGASGAVSGILGFYFLWFPRNRVRVWVFLFLFAEVISLPARLLLGVYIVFDNLIPLLLSGGSGSGVAYGAHIGGFVAGWGLAVPTGAWLARRSARRPPRAPPDDDPRVDLPAAEAFARAIDDGKLAEAAAMLFRLPVRMTRARLGPLDKIRLGLAFEEKGEAKVALATYQRTLADHPNGPGRSSAHLGAARLLAQRFNLRTAARQHLYAVLEEDATPDEEREARRLLAFLEKNPEEN